MHTAEYAILTVVVSVTAMLMACAGGWIVQKNFNQVGVAIRH